MSVVPLKHRDKSIISHFSDGLRIVFSKGQTIIHGFQEPNGVYLIKEGFVKAYSVSLDRNVNLLLIHEVGEFIPLPWALNGTNVTGLSYEAMTDVVVLEASKDRLRSAMGNNPWLAEEILSQTVNIIALYTQRIQTLEFRSARERIVAEMIYLTKRFGRQQNGGIVIDVPITHQDIADSISMNRETASRTIELLFSEGLLVQRDHLFCVVDVTRLLAILGE